MKAILNFEFNQSRVRKSQGKKKKKNRMIVNFLNRVLIIYAR